MWARFVRFCLDQNPPLWPKDITAEHIESHLASRRSEGALNDRYVWRLLTLIDNILQVTLRVPDGARTTRPTAAAEVLMAHEKYRYANAGGRDRLPEHLGIEQANQLIRHLRKVLPVAGGRRPQLSWQDVRNCAAVATQLGAGLGPGDVRAMLVTGAASEPVDSAVVIWRLTVPSNNGTPERQTPLARWAAHILAHWIVVRKEQGFEALKCPVLFPATRAGGAWGKVGQYEASVKVLNEASLGADARGSFRLRHTFALRQLRAGKPDTEVARWLGVGPEVIERYRGVLQTDPHVV